MLRGTGPDPSVTDASWSQAEMVDTQLSEHSAPAVHLFRHVNFTSVKISYRTGSWVGSTQSRSAR